ncbi:MAG: TetR/AcrR family transcriptional regulator [Actinobacteria bacterium]|nr:TetR/AcrR family transcriptional regulator [Actinomycetota bacterium]
MVRQVKRKRAYDNSARLEQSNETRRSILDAARSQLLERGYRATTIADIARVAGVHVDTVYTLVGRKPVLMRELIEHAISGTDEVVSADRRGYVEAIRAERDPRRKLAIYARATREIHGRLAPLLLALRDASTTEPEVRAVWDEISERRATNMRELVKDLKSVGGIRAGLSIAEAADTIWVTNSAEVFVLLTTERGWTTSRYERWLVDTWTRLLLPGD